MKHYLCFKTLTPSTYRVYIADTVRWLPHGRLELPIPSKYELLRNTIDDLITTRQSYVENNILPPEGTTYIKNLLYLNDIFNNCDLRDPPKNIQHLLTFQGLKFNHKIPPYFQGCNFI